MNIWADNASSFASAAWLLQAQFIWQSSPSCSCVYLPRQHVEVLQSILDDIKDWTSINTSSCKTVLMAGLVRLQVPLRNRIVAASMLSCFRAVLRAGGKSKVSLITFGAHSVQQQDHQQLPLGNLATGQAVTRSPSLHLIVLDF